MDLVHIERQQSRAVFFLRVFEDEHDLGHPRRFAPARSIEDHVEHRVAAQALGGLLAKHPLECIDDVGLAAPIGPDNASNRRVKDEFRPIGETLKSLQDELFQSHELWSSVTRDKAKAKCKRQNSVGTSKILLRGADPRIRRR